MTIIIAGLSHHTAPIEVRERVVVGESEYVQRVQQLCGIPGVDEAVIVSTCNRLELYCSGGPQTANAILQWIHSINDIAPNAYDSHFYIHNDEAAVRHLISVAGGLDSLVIGEPQILGQLKQAWQAARNAGTVSTVLDRMFQHAFGAAKRIRANTDVGDHPVSVAYTTVVLARQIFDDLSRRTVVLIGAGDMIRLCAQHLAHGKSDSETNSSMIIVNRNLQHAQELAEEISDHNNIEVSSLDNLDLVLPRADILITSTSSPDTLIGPEMVKAALQQRRHRPMFMVDIAVPRDIDPAISVLDGIYLYTIDDLQQVVDENLAQRGKAAKNAMPAVEEDARSFMRWVNGSRAARTIENVRKAAAEQADELKTRALRQLAAGQDAEAVLSQLTHTLTNRILHRPSTNVREAAESRDFKILEAAEKIFGEVSGNPEDNHISPGREESEQ